MEPTISGVVLNQTPFCSQKEGAVGEGCEARVWSLRVQRVKVQKPRVTEVQQSGLILVQSFYVIYLLLLLVYEHKYLWFSIWLCNSQPIKTKGACSHAPPPHETSSHKESKKSIQANERRRVCQRAPAYMIHQYHFYLFIFYL